MKKETTIAIFFGIFFGAIIAVFLILKNKDAQLQKTKTIAPDIQTKNNANPNLINSSLLDVESPTDGMIVTKNTITFKGKVDQDSTLIFQSPAKDLVKTAKKGSFSIDFPLALGENIVHIAAYSKNPQVRSQEKEIKVYFLDEL